MNIVGIVTEYNPFHNGHKLHLEQTKKLTNADGVICVMSGNFVQRGLPSILDKWTRAQIAVLNGVDLVIELPTIFSVSSAEFFAKGAVDILNQTSVVNSLCFGSEVGEIDIIMKVAKILSYESDEFKSLLRNHLNLGKSYVKARSEALLEYFKKYEYINLSTEEFENFLNSSNNILGIEYCKSIIKSESSIKPVTIKRIGSSYNDISLSSSFASATAIREQLYKESSIDELYKYMPDTSIQIINEKKKNSNKFPSNDDFLKYIRYKIITNPGSFSNLPDNMEGLENKFIKEIMKAKSADELIMLVKSKRYAYTRLSRLICQYFIGFENYDIQSLRTSKPNYLRILGLNNVGAQIVKEIKKKSQINILNKIPKQIDDSMLELDLRATNAYSLINPTIPVNADYLISPFIHK
ncbi:nucleotidyltransferase [Clostridium fungisolvens]|uniref:tRNA(Met) cytidine acetate ligase n=1 Tax=Clostridium fungisolvens TaxID=1604897 RepID=A0A6V8SLC2_9CLOT|nr:nucleotidyltransferase [Clostridium fungisolvens]GFP75968.1 tRNA(Met) cytidine acetate ligase [Clostridium fungisolvens]